MKIIMLGPPGVGKGTISKMLVERSGAKQISTGDILREAAKKGTELGMKAKGFMDKGDLVPDEIVIGLLKENVKSVASYILDGFPRTIPQAEALFKEGIDIDKVLNLTSPDEVIVQRLSSRRMCRKCGRIYNLSFVKTKVEGVCDECGGELYQRDDDKPEAIAKRLEVYHSQTEPLIKFYEERDMLITVDASYPDPKVVFERVIKAMGSAE